MKDVRMERNEAFKGVGAYAIVDKYNCQLAGVSFKRSRGKVTCFLQVIGLPLVKGTVADEETIASWKIDARALAEACKQVSYLPALEDGFSRASVEHVQDVWRVTRSKKVLEASIWTSAFRDEGHHVYEVI